MNPFVSIPQAQYDTVVALINALAPILARAEVNREKHGFYEVCNVDGDFERLVDAYEALAPTFWPSAKVMNSTKLRGNFQMKKLIAGIKAGKPRKQIDFNMDTLDLGTKTDNFALLSARGKRKVMFKKSKERPSA